MTSNMIAYHNAQELKRHNIETEKETNRHQVVQEALQKWSNAIQKWQVAVNNLHYARMDAETERSNRARESQNLLSLQESMRANLSNEAIKRASNAIQSAQVAETSRHQRTMESIQDRLNSSVIELNAARTDESGANTGLLSAKTVTEGYQPNKIINEIDLTNSAANLNRKKMQTEESAIIRNSADTAVDVVKGVGEAIRIIRFGGGSKK